MRRRSFDRILTTWFFFLLVVIIASTWLSFKSLERIVANDRRVDFSRSVIDELEATLSTLKDAEAGQRGFIITGEESYLDPYDASISRIAEHVRRLGALTADDPDQRRSLEVLSRAISTKQGEMRETIDLRRGVSFAAAQAIILTNEGKRTMEEIRRIVGLMQSHERDAARAADGRLRLQ